MSDIWRSYITQRLLWDIGDQLAFTAPSVSQLRTPHSYLADLDAERDLYFKTPRLLHFLASWSAEGDEVTDQADATSSHRNIVDLPARMEQLFISLYERSYIEQEDVLAAQLWLQSLADSGYEFPALIRHH